MVAASDELDSPEPVFVAVAPTLCGSPGARVGESGSENREGSCIQLPGIGASFGIVTLTTRTLQEFAVGRKYIPGQTRKLKKSYPSLTGGSGLGTLGED